MKWTAEQDAALRAMYRDQPLGQIMVATGRSIQAIYVRARLMGLSRPHVGGFKIGNTIRNNRKAAPKPPTLSERVVALLRETGDAWTAREIATELSADFPHTSMAMRFLHRANSVYIAGFRPKRQKNDPQFVPAYAFGRQEDAPIPDHDDAELVFAPSPVPVPALHPWIHAALTREAITQEFTE